MDALIVLFVVLFFAAWVAAFVYWIVAIVEVARIPETQYRAAGSEKTTWILVVALAGIIGALIWLFVKRNDVRAATGAAGAPAGWYPEPGTGALWWWDGYRWTDARQPAPPTEPR